MIRIAAHISAILEELLNAEELPVDYIKVPGCHYPENQVEIQRAGALRPLLLHLHQPGVLMLADANPDAAIQADIIGKLVALSGTPYLSTHIAAGISDDRTAEGLSACIVANYRLLQAKCGMPVMLENASYRRRGALLPLAARPEFIAHIIEAAGCALLLDLAHARVSAWHLDMLPEEYLHCLPLDRVGEIHVSGPALWHGDGLRDLHGPLDEADFALLEWLLPQVPVEVVTLEYGGLSDEVEDATGARRPYHRNRKDVLRAQLMRLAALVGR